MKAVKANITQGLQKGSYVDVCDNSGAKIIKIFAIKRSKTVHGKNPECGVSDLVMASVVKGKPEMRKQVVFAVIVRQKREYMRRNGLRVKFEDNAAVVLKDDKGNPKGTLFKGPIAKEVAERWPAISKLAPMAL